MWTLVALGLCLYNFANVFSIQGVADVIVEYDAPSPIGSPEERLLKISDLLAKRLITEAEYQERRKAILSAL